MFLVFDCNVTIHLMVVHSPLVLVLPRAGRDCCSPMVFILFVNLENSIGQEEEEVWDLVFVPCLWQLSVGFAAHCLGGGWGGHAP